MKITEYGIARLRARFPMWITQAKTVIEREGIIGFILRGSKKAYRTLRYSSDPHTFHRVHYGDWMKNIESRYLNEGYQKQLLSKVGQNVKFSIIFPSWNMTDEQLTSAIESVLGQSYPNWELCISDGSTEKTEEKEKLLSSYAKKYLEKIKLSFLRKVLEEVPPINIVQNSNNAISLATGEYCVFMDCDDELSENCLLELAWAIQKKPQVVFLYSDFDKIDEEGNRFDPSFWPDWSPHTVLSVMYTTHVTCYRRDILEKLGGIREETEGAQDWDLVLRLRETVKREEVVHIPKILYHWRVYAGSTSMSNSGAKSWAYEGQKKVLEDWVKRNGERATVEEGPNRINLRVRFSIIGKPKVAIIIPFRDKVKYLRRCVASVLEQTAYEAYELLLVDNQSVDGATHSYVEQISKEEP